MGESYDLDFIPVPKEDDRPFLTRLSDYLKGGGWQDPQPGQRGTFVPSRINEQGKAEPAVPGIIQQPAEGLQSLMTAPLSDIVRSGDRDAMRAASEASFDVASMLPAAGVAAGRTMPPHAAMTEELQRKPMYHGTRGKYRNQDRPAYWSTDDRKLASTYAIRDNYDLADERIAPRVEEVFHRFKNPVYHDAKGQTYLEFDTDSAAQSAVKNGHDGIVIKNVVDPPWLFDEMPKPSTVTAALKRGTVFDRWGNQVFSNPDDLNTSAVIAAMQGQERPKGITAYHGSPHDFDTFATPAFFSTKEGIANRYRMHGGGGDNINGKYKEPPPGYILAVDHYLDNGKDKVTAKKALKVSREQAKQSGLVPDEEFQAALDYLQSDKTLGTSYEVRLREPDYTYPFLESPDQKQAIADAMAKGYKVLGLYGGDELVALDPSAIDIVRKYSNAPDPTTAAILALLTNQQGAQPQQ